MSLEQMVLPSSCRMAVLNLTHKIPLAGHLGKNKTTRRILQRFYWPTLYRDVANYCRSCEECQKTPGRTMPKAPFISLLIVSEPFSRIAMDIVGLQLFWQSFHSSDLRLCHSLPRGNSPKEHWHRTCCRRVDEDVRSSGNPRWNIV